MLNYATIIVIEQVQPTEDWRHWKCTLFTQIKTGTQHLNLLSYMTCIDIPKYKEENGMMKFIQLKFYHLYIVTVSHSYVIQLFLWISSYIVLVDNKSNNSIL